jgi:hypothetical protein
MGLKTVTKLVIEKGEQVFGTNKIKLIGAEALIDADTVLSDSIKSKQVTNNKCCFSACYGCGCEFLYRIDQIQGGKTLTGEIGRGYIEHDQDSDQHFLVRMQPFYVLDETQNIIDPAGTILDFLPLENSHLVVSNYISNNPQEILCEDGCVLTSIAPHVMHPVQLTKDTILGRIGFDGVKALKLSQLWNIESFTESVVKSLLSYAKQLVFKTTQIDVKKLKTTQIIFRPSKKATEQAGTMYLDEESGTLKIYNGASWRTLKYEDT